LLRPSLVPPPPIRELRDLTRQRTQLVQEKATVANRIQKALEDANIKLAAVASDVLGDSGRDMLRALIGGETDPGKLADLARKRLRAKIPALRLALQGRVTAHHRFLLQVHLDHLEHLEGLIRRLGERVEEALAPCAEAVDLLTTIPGVSQRTAEVLIAETGADRSRFPSAGHLASWAGMCPGPNESAGQRRSGKTTKGSRWLRTALGQAAWAASPTKGTALAAQYRRHAARRGRKRALVALGHTLLEIAYHVLQGRVPDQERGPDDLDRRQAEQRTQQLVRQRERLGHKVTLAPKDDAA
jgi:transposase